MKKETVSKELVNAMFPAVKCEIVTMPETVEYRDGLIGLKGFLIGGDSTGHALIFVDSKDGETHTIEPGAEVLIYEAVDMQDTAAPVVHNTVTEAGAHAVNEAAKTAEKVEEVKEEEAAPAVNPTGSGDEYPYNLKAGDFLDCKAPQNGLSIGDVVIFVRVKENHNIEIKKASGAPIEVHKDWFTPVKK